MKFDWDDLRLFLFVARKGGLAAAAAAAGKSPPTLGRRMLALERAIGAELFHRLPRGYDLTEEGRGLYNQVAELEAMITPIAAAKDRRRKTLVKISAGTWMTQYLCSRAGAILMADDDVSIRFVAADHVLDIAHREAVIGIRNQRPDQPGLACRTVGRVRFAGYGAGPDAAPWVRVVGNTPSARWLRAHTEPGECIEVGNPRNALDLALAGMARALLPTFVGDTRAGLVRATPVVEELDHDQWLVVHHEDRFIAEVRRVTDRLHGVLVDLHKRTLAADRQPAR